MSHSENDTKSAGWRIKELPKTDRPRERLERLGPEALTDAELLAIFFRTGHQGMNAVDMGQALAAKHGGLTGLARLTIAELCKQKGIGPAKACELMAVFEMGRRLAKARSKDLPMDDPDVIYEYFGTEMRSLEKESLRIALVNTRLRLIRVEEISLGHLSESLGHPREILRPAIQHAAYGFILVHNHPSGDPTPSLADKRLTRSLNDAAKLMQIVFVDHLIIGMPSDEHEAYYSFATAGYL